MKNILFISYDGMTDPLGQSQVIPYLAGLTKFGYTFTILSCDKPDAYSKNRKYVEDLLAALPIRWVSIPYHRNPPVLSSIYDLQRLKAKSASLHRRTPFDMVHTRPGIPTLVAAWLKKKFGIRFFNDVRGFWADERVDGGMWNLRSPLYKKVYDFFKQHEYECLELADHITCLTNAAKQEMLSWENIRRQPLSIDVIPCSADLNLFDPATISEPDRTEKMKALGFSPDDVVISYLGSIGGWYLTHDMMRFFKKLSTRMPAARFLFISPHRHEQILSAANEAGIDPSKIATVHAKRHEVPLYLSLSDYSLFFIKPCYSKLSSSPTKHGEIMAMGIPVITNSGVGDVAEIVNRYDAGILLADLSDEEMEKAIRKLENDPVFDRTKIKAGALAFYSLEQAVESYRFAYAQAFRNPVPGKN